MLSSCSLQNILCLSINFLGKKKFSVDVSHRPANIVEIQYTLGKKKKKEALGAPSVLLGIALSIWAALG